MPSLRISTIAPSFAHRTFPAHRIQIASPWPRSLLCTPFIRFPFQCQMLPSPVLTPPTPSSKRPMSCNPRPTSRFSTSGASSLRRSGSYLSLTDLRGASPQPVGYSSVHRFIDNQEKRFKQSYDDPRSSHSSLPKYDLHRQRSSSPLAPTPQSLPPRPSFPRSKPEPDLYKLALTTRMRSSQEGQKILCMGSHFAVSILNATRELEGIVAAQQRDADGDVVMGDTHLGNSWLVVCSEDWEMVDC